jgi:hypothetical protein
VAASVPSATPPSSAVPVPSVPPSVEEPPSSLLSLSI